MMMKRQKLFLVAAAAPLESRRDRHRDTDKRTHPLW